jgi:hypothetical protein
MPFGIPPELVFSFAGIPTMAPIGLDTVGSVYSSRLIVTYRIRVSFSPA